MESEREITELQIISEWEEMDAAVKSAKRTTSTGWMGRSRPENAGREWPNGFAARSERSTTDRGNSPGAPLVDRRLAADRSGKTVTQRCCTDRMIATAAHFRWKPSASRPPPADRHSNASSLAVSLSCNSSTPPAALRHSSMNSRRATRRGSARPASNCRCTPIPSAVAPTTQPLNRRRRSYDKLWR